MTTSTILLLLVGAASTIAFTPHQAHVHRSRRDAPSGSSSGSSSSSFSSSSSGAGAGSVSGPGFGGGYGGAGNFGGAGQPFYNNQPFDYESLFRQFYENLQRLSQMHAAYANNYGPGFGSNSLDYGGSSAGGYGGFGNQGGFGGGYGGPGFQPGFGHTGGFGGFGGQPGSSSSSSSSFGNQGGYGGQGGVGGSGASPSIGASGVQPGFATSGSSPSFGAGGYGTQTGYGGNPGAAGAPGATAGLDTRGGFANSDSSSSGPVGAQASVSLSDRGGFGEASYFPPGLGSRIGQAIPAPSKGNYAVFASSSSGTSDVNGKRTSYKEATYGVNDNGKVSTVHVKDP